jgi:hypothetical protein
LFRADPTVNKGSTLFILMHDLSFMMWNLVKPRALWTHPYRANL